MSILNILKLGKYKGIIISIALFLLLDASVLTINFYLSFEISDNANNVNIAGRQRMLSQRMMKSLLDSQVSPDDRKRAIEELQQTSELFDKTLLAFSRGGETMGTNGEKVFLQPILRKEGKASIDKAIQIWRPYSETINKLIFDFSQSANTVQNSLNMAISAGQDSNLKLLKLMNSLTQDLESYASSKADTLRLIQTIGISLALINFFIILFHFLRQLNDSDKKLEHARKETHEILATVNSGLFLINEDLIMSNQYSTHMEKLFGQSDIARNTFDELLKDLVSEKDLSTMRNYIKLLFKPSIKEKLISDLNPLDKTEIRIKKDKNTYLSKFLNFTFTRVIETDAITHILVTVTDITHQVTLANQLDQERSKNIKQFELLSSLLKADGQYLPSYFRNCLAEFDAINEILKEQTKGSMHHHEKVEQIFRIIHNIKGESASLNLSKFSDMAHEFEDELLALKNDRALEGNSFLHLAVLLNEFISEIEIASELIDKLKEYVIGIQPEKNTTITAIHELYDWSNLETLVKGTSCRQGKKVEFIHAGLSDRKLPHTLQKAINNISIQLIRNSIVHGIESPEERLSAEKREIGEITMQLSQRANGSLQLICKDDGVGINVEAIRLQAIKLNIISEQESESMDKKQIINLIFSSSFSSSNSTNIDAGRGIGMSLVRSIIRDFNGHLSISTKRGLGTKFVITFPREALENTLDQVA